MACTADTSPYVWFQAWRQIFLKSRWVKTKLHRNSRVVKIAVRSLPGATPVAFTIIYVATSDDKIGILKIHGFQWSIYKISGKGKIMSIWQWRHMSVIGISIVRSTAGKENINAPHHWLCEGNRPLCERIRFIKSQHCGKHFHDTCNIKFRLQLHDFNLHCSGITIFHESKQSVDVL